MRIPKQKHNPTVKTNVHMRIPGKQQRKTLFLGTYRAGNGWITEQNQLEAIRATEEGARNLWEPSQLWYDDLKALVKQKQEEGCKVVITGDFNEDLKNPRSNMR